jgi:hypothetical protein
MTILKWLGNIASSLLLAIIAFGLIPDLFDFLGVPDRIFNSIFFLNYFSLVMVFSIGTVFLFNKKYASGVFFIAVAVSYILFLRSIGDGF